jgi:hypothetical protein
VAQDSIDKRHPEPVEGRWAGVTAKLITIAAALFGFSKTVACTFSRSIK